MSNKNRKFVKKKEPWEVVAREAMADVAQAVQAAKYALEAKSQLLAGTLDGASAALLAAGCQGLEMRLADGGAMFVASDVNDYLSDGEPFTAFRGTDAEGREYVAAMRVYVDDEDEDAISADLMVTRTNGGVEELLQNGAWVALSEVDYEDDEDDEDDEEDEDDGAADVPWRWTT